MTININVDEGTVAAIKHINVVGNQAFSDEEIADLFELQTTGWLSFFSNDKYSKEKLTGDLEKLTSYYMDRVTCSSPSTPPGIGLPNMEEVYITANITEGEVSLSARWTCRATWCCRRRTSKALPAGVRGQIFLQQLVTSTESTSPGAWATTAIISPR